MISPEPTQRPLLAEKRRQQYLEALTELVGSISLHESTPIQVDEFCTRYNLKPSFFDALRDMDALEMDYMKPCTGGLIPFRKTENLYKITPEEVLLQIRKTGGTKALLGRSTSTTEPDDEARDEQAAPEPLQIDSKFQPVTARAKRIVLDMRPESSTVKPVPAAPEPEPQEPVDTSAMTEPAKLIADPPNLDDWKAGELTSKITACQNSYKAVRTGQDIIVAHEKATGVYHDLRKVAAPVPEAKPAQPFMEKLADINRLYNKAGMLSGQLFDVMVEINALNQTA